MNSVIAIGTVPWTREEMRDSLAEFRTIYDGRPIADNSGGMKSPHMFLTWFVLKKLKPKAIVESGVWFGQGTWLFEQACPDAELHCIDLNLNRIQYRSKKAKYYDRDFSTIDWSHLPKKETVLFFDDHQNAYERVKTAAWFGFTHFLMEDNYPPSQGDCYSLKKIFMHSGFTPGTGTSAQSRVKEKIGNLLGIRGSNQDHISPNDVDEKYLRQNVAVYCEMPPVFKTARTRWGDLWDDENYPTPVPLLTSVEKEYQRIFLDEADYYTWICYVKLKSRQPEPCP